MSWLSCSLMSFFTSGVVVFLCVLGMTYWFSTARTAYTTAFLDQQNCTQVSELMVAFTLPADVETIPQLPVNVTFAQPGLTTVGSTITCDVNLCNLAAGFTSPSSGYINCNNYQVNSYYNSNRLATPQTAYASRWWYFRPWVIAYSTLWAYTVITAILLLTILFF